jgi:hypothetical protein
MARVIGIRYAPLSNSILLPPRLLSGFAAIDGLKQAEYNSPI